jgi:hypothetical protein
LAFTLKTGAVESLTTTFNVADPVLLCESVAVHLTLVVPTGNVLPDAGTQVTSGAVDSAISEADALNVTTEPLGLFASVVIVDGTTGAVESLVVIVKLLEPVLFARSVNEQ